MQNPTWWREFVRDIHEHEGSLAGKDIDPAIGSDNPETLWPYPYLSALRIPQHQGRLIACRDAESSHELLIHRHRGPSLDHPPRRGRPCLDRFVQLVDAPEPVVNAGDNVRRGKTWFDYGIDWIALA